MFSFFPLQCLAAWFKDGRMECQSVKGCRGAAAEIKQINQIYTLENT